jgi:antirestriction protein ArdC
LACTWWVMATQTEIRQQITQQIVDALQQNALPWRRPWKSTGGGLPRNIVSKRRYNGINVPLLLMAGVQFNFQSNWWGTYQQWQELRGQVRGGERGTRIVLFRNIEKRDAEANDRFRSQPVESAVPIQPDFQPAEELVATTHAQIRYGGDRAFYHRPIGGNFPDHSGGDYIQMPSRCQFQEQWDYYGTLFHELGHWTECRLDWSGSYAMGELVAEMTACFVSHELDVPPADLANSASYIKCWLEAMASDPKFVFAAATQASKATDFLLSFVAKENLSNRPKFSSL